MSDDIADNWEDLENGEDLDKKLDKLVQPEEKKENRCDIMSIPKLQDETTGRSAYMPTIKILKRETNHTQNNCTPQDKLPSKPIKTYEEREAAYAEARLRILGAAFHPEEELEALSTNSGLESVVKSNSSSSASITAPASSGIEQNSTIEQNGESLPANHR